MKNFFITLCVICIVVPIIVYGAAIIKYIQMDSNCISYLKMAADANNVKLANKHLSSSIDYLEKHNLTSGNTKILIYKPTNDIGLWYENLKAAQEQLQVACDRDDLTELEESNILMKLRETLCDGEGSITHPKMISFYPNHAAWAITMWLIWLLWICAVIFGVIAYYKY